MSAKQLTLDGEPATPAPHLTKRFPGRNDATAIQISASCEWYCKSCHNRVTRSTSKPIEYGHALTCDHSISASRGWR